MINFRRLKADEIDVKVGNVSAYGYTLLLYKNARVDMAILDETVGAENWQRDHKEVKGNLYCGIGINQPVIQHENDGRPYIFDRWVWKWDCGVESAFGDKEKGEASDSFKRAGFNWGIGRELYTSPLIKIYCDTVEEKDKNGKAIYKLPKTEKYRTFHVLDIAYNDKGEIVLIKIVDDEGNLAFSFGVKVLGGDYVLSKGKNAGKKIRDCDDEYLQWCLDNAGVGEELKANIRKYYEEK